MLVLALGLVSSAVGLKTFITHLRAGGDGPWAMTAAPNCYATPKACFGASYLGGSVGAGAITQVAWDGRSIKTIYSFDVFSVRLCASRTHALSPDLTADSDMTGPLLLCPDPSGKHTLPGACPSLQQPHSRGLHVSGWKVRLWPHLCL